MAVLAVSMPGSTTAPAKVNTQQAFAVEATEALAKIMESTAQITEKITASSAKILESAQSYSDVLKLNPVPAHPGQQAPGGLNPRQKATQAVKDRHILINFSLNETLHIMGGSYWK